MVGADKDVKIKTHVNFPYFFFYYFVSISVLFSQSISPPSKTVNHNRKFT